jgi:cytochrome P450
MTSRPPSPSGAPLVGHTIGYARDQFGFVRRSALDCGDVFLADLLGFGEVCYLTHPAGFERVLSTDREAFGRSDVFTVAFGEGLLAVEGSQWATQRSRLEEFFSPGRIRSYAAEMVALTERRTDRWTDGETLSLLDEATALTLEIICSTLFGRRLDPDGGRALRRAAADLNAWFTPTSLVLPRSVPTPSRRRFERARTTLRAQLRDLIDERAAGQRGNDLLSVLVAASDAEGGDDGEGGHPSAGKDGTDALSETAIVDQLVTLLFAGHETTALALTYAFYELGSDRRVRHRFHGELDEVLGGERPTPGDVSALSVTERIVTEALRLYPPAHTIPRVATRDVRIDGYRVPAGTRTHLAVHSVHRDERFYDDPLAFRPARWRDTGPESKGYAYVPFGAGPRTCIGRRFALLEAILVLATIGQDYRLVPQEPLELDPRMSTQPAGNVPITVRERRPS